MAGPVARPAGTPIDAIDAHTLGPVLTALEGIAADFNRDAASGKAVSIADLIVLANWVGIEIAAKAAGAN